MTATFWPPEDNSAMKTAAKPPRPISSLFTKLEYLKHGVISQLLHVMFNI